METTSRMALMVLGMAKTISEYRLKEHCWGGKVRDFLSIIC